ncbi:unnamed protein product [Lupinus luteus]|uniref:Uncharacterized protein n=1 Tax=Lupinus luteus TaxID=3873 RepID=A0AAV1WN23_LUPLU
MKMKKVACVVLFAAASINAAMAHDDKRADAPAPRHKRGASALVDDGFHSKPSTIILWSAALVSTPTAAYLRRSKRLSK